MKGQHPPRYEMKWHVFTLFAKGYDAAEVAKMMQVTPETVRGWCAGERGRAAEHKKLQIAAESAENRRKV